MSREISRRHALLGATAAGVGVPLLAACGDDGQEAVDQATSEAAEAVENLASKADIPEGGGTIYADADTVVTQPTAGEFKAFSATCTHQSCKVSSVTDTINCKCHGSMYSISDGSVVKGPATQPLPEKQVTLDGDGISVS